MILLLHAAASSRAGVSLSYHHLIYIASGEKEGDKFWRSVESVCVSVCVCVCKREE